MKLLILVILITLLALPLFAMPTYTLNPGGSTNNGGTYGSTGIPNDYSDETGNQLFDGDYGKWDWIIRQQPSSLEQYWEHYVDQKGYGYSWVGWRDQATITIDCGTGWNYEQLGLHMYQGRDITLPENISISFSDNGIDFTSLINYNPQPLYSQYNDNVFWVSSSFQPIASRYAQINISGGLWKFIDEISINNMDGAQFQNVVPEPSSLLAIGGGIIGLVSIKRRKK